MNRDTRHLRIAFQTYSTSDWMAGIVHFQDLFVTLGRLGDECPELSLVQWNGSMSEAYAMLAPLVDKTITAAYPRRPYSAGIPPQEKLTLRTRIKARLMNNHPPPAFREVASVLRANGVDCSLSVMVNGREDLSVPLIIWVFDLQHHHLPELFDAGERAKRDLLISAEAEVATLLLVNSAAVRHDLEEFVPAHAHKIRCLQWVSDIPASVYTRDPAEVVELYHLPPKFIYLPNQFWMHKNHLKVLEALRLLAVRGVYPTVVCTGSLSDHRNPEHVTELIRQVSLGNLREQFVILGQVPRSDVFALMRQSVAVLNPSQFEGLGLSTAEARSLGKRVLLSDLPALREQNAPCALYFNAGDAYDLADKLETIWQTTTPGPDLALERRARAELPERQIAYAQAFVKLAEESIRMQRKIQGQPLMNDALSRCTKSGVD